MEEETNSCLAHRSETEQFFFSRVQYLHESSLSLSLSRTHYSVYFFVYILSSASHLMMMMRSRFDGVLLLRHSENEAYVHLINI